MTHPNNRYRDAVQVHFRILRRHHQELELEDRRFIPFGPIYGYSVSEIAAETGLSVSYVQRVLRGL